MNENVHIEMEQLKNVIDERDSKIEEMKETMDTKDKQNEEIATKIHEQIATMENRIGFLTSKTKLQAQKLKDDGTTIKNLELQIKNLEQPKTDGNPKNIEELTTLKATITRLDTTNYNQSQMLKEFREEMKNNQLRINSLESNLKETRNTLRTESAELKDERERNLQLTREKEQLEKELSAMKDKNKELNDDKRKLQGQLLKLVEISEQKQEREEKLLDRIERENPGAADNPQKVIIIADSNKKYIEKNLSNNTNIKYEFNQDIFTVEQLKDNIDEVIKNHEAGTHYTLLEGTNDIRTTNRSGKTAEELKNVIFKLRTETSAIVQVLQIPPHGDTLKDTLVKYVNDNLSKLPSKDAGIIFTTVIDKLDETPYSSILMPNHDFHINEGTGLLYANAIQNFWNKHQHLKEITTDHSLAAHIIGREGRNIKRLRQTTNTDIRVLNMKGMSKITIRGAPKDIDVAKEEINRTIQERCEEEENQGRKRERSRSRNSESRKHERSRSPKRARNSQGRDRYRSSSRGRHDHERDSRHSGYSRDDRRNRNRSGDRNNRGDRNRSRERDDKYRDSRRREHRR